MSISDLYLSARITGIVMNYPLFDGGVSQKARQLIAAGKLSEALAEYHRLASMGSALAKCVLAYLNLRNLPGSPRNVDAAKGLANAALSGEPGYANYVLSYVAYYEKHTKKAIDCMVESYKARFIPASSALGLIFAQGYGVTKRPKDAETFFLRAIFAGHIPATLMLCLFYMKGDCGLVLRMLGTVLYPAAFLYVWLASRFMIFSIRTFRHFNLDVPSMFNERALRE
jgi:TPR repeat protein